MSVPESIQLKLSVYKPKLKLKLGQLVFSKEDKKRKRLMVISGFLPLDYVNGIKADYICSWISNQGKPGNQIFTEKELLISEL